MGPPIGPPIELSIGAGGGLKLVGVENPVGAELGIEEKLGDTLGVDGGGETGVCLFAASNAFACKSLSPPANMIPDNVPVKNVAIGIIISKNFWSIGLIAFNGCVIKMIE